MIANSVNFSPKVLECSSTNIAVKLSFTQFENDRFFLHVYTLFGCYTEPIRIDNDGKAKCKEVNCGENVEVKKNPECNSRNEFKEGKSKGENTWL